MAKRVKSVKAWAVASVNGTIDPTSIVGVQYMSEKEYRKKLPYADMKNLIIPVLITPIVTKRKG